MAVKVDIDARFKVNPNMLALIKSITNKCMK